MAAMRVDKREIMNRLRQDILRLQGDVPTASSAAQHIGLGPVEKAFPNGAFPVRGIHEFIYGGQEEAAATSGFLSGLLSRFMKDSRVCLWISASRALFPPVLKAFGVEPHHVIFVDMAREKDVMWAMEEALKCGGLAAVVAEVQTLDFIQSRRLQLAVEKSRVTGFVIRSTSQSIGATACVARWHIRPIASALDEGMPGVGFPRWEVELLKVRNGNPGRWKMEWAHGRFLPLAPRQTQPLMSGWDRKSG